MSHRSSSLRFSIPPAISITVSTSRPESCHPDRTSLDNPRGSFVNFWNRPRPLINFAPMSFIQRVAKRLPSSPSLPLDDAPSEKGGAFSRFAFFRRRIRLKGNSSISIPLGFVLLFPCLVIVLILLLFVRHPSSPGGILIPAGTPPSIRFAFAPTRLPQIISGLFSNGS